MEVLFFILDTACNRACSYCFYETGHLERVKVAMTGDDWLKLTGDAAKAGVQNIVLTGGEPLLGGESRLAMIENIIRRAGDNRIETLLVTNGEFLTPLTAERLVNAGLKAVSISLDSLSGIWGYKIKGWKAVEASLKAGMRVTLIMTVTCENYHDISPIYRFAATRSLGLILQPAFIPKGHIRFEELSLESMQSSWQEAILKAIAQWADGFGLTDYPAYLKSLLGLRGGRRPNRCEMGDNAAVVNCDGSLLHCFHRAEMRVGSVREEPFDVLLERLKKTGKILEDAPCFGMQCLSLFAGS